MEVSARTRNAILTAIGVIAAIVLVAVASRGSTSLGDLLGTLPPGERPASAPMS